MIRYIEYLKAQIKLREDIMNGECTHSEGRKAMHERDAYSDALKNMESSSRIMSVTKERTYTAKEMHEAFEAGQDYQYSNSIYPDFKNFLAGYAT